MHVRTLMSLGVSLLAWTLATETAHAQEADQSAAATKEKRFFVGLSAGPGYAVVKHPLINANGFSTIALGMHAGVNLTERLAIGLELASFEHGMTRNSGTDPFTPTSFLSPQAGCDKCADRPPPVGGWIKQTSATFNTIGPRVEFSPFGRDGLYLGATAGVSIMLGVDTLYGVAGAARAGYRYRWANTLGVALEGGVHAQQYSTGVNYFPYATVMIRPYF